MSRNATIVALHCVLPLDSMDPLRVPVSPAERKAQLDARRRAKMATSAHAYVRGTTDSFYEWLSGAQRKTLPQGPAIWVGGDCHVGNLGPLADADGSVRIELRDLDQTVIGAPAHDVIRLALSMAMAVRASEPPIGSRAVARRGSRSAATESRSSHLQLPSSSDARSLDGTSSAQMTGRCLSHQHADAR